MATTSRIDAYTRTLNSDERQIVVLLSRSGLVEQCPMARRRGVAEALVRAGEVHRLSPSDEWTLPSPAERVHILVSGCATIRDARGGTVAIAGPVLIGRGPLDRGCGSSAMTALCAARLLTIALARFEQLAEHEPALWQMVAVALERRLRLLEEQDIELPRVLFVEADSHIASADVQSAMARVQPSFVTSSVSARDMQASTAPAATSLARADLGVVLARAPRTHDGAEALARCLSMLAEALGSDRVIALTDAALSPAIESAFAHVHRTSDDPTVAASLVRAHIQRVGIRGGSPSASPSGEPRP